MSLSALQRLLIQEIQQQLSPDLLLSNFRKTWSPLNPTQGFCSVASEALFFMLGGQPQGWKAQTARDEDGIVHWWLAHEDGHRLDPTQEQYTSQGKTPPYLKARGGGFQGMRQDAFNGWGFGRKPSDRAARLLEKILDHRWQEWTKASSSPTSWWHLEGLSYAAAEDWLQERSSNALLTKYATFLTLKNPASISVRTHKM